MPLEYIPGVTECVHLIFPNPNGVVMIGAPVLGGAAWAGGGPHTIACQPNDSVRPKCFTSETAAVNCPLCLESADFQRIKTEQLVGLSDADRRAMEHVLKQRALKDKQESQNDAENFAASQ